MIIESNEVIEFAWSQQNRDLMTLKNTRHVLLFIVFFSTKSVHAQAVEVNGAVKDFAYTGTPDSGMIRWAYSDFEGFDGTEWLSLTATTDR
jgi:hypothetical protein